MRFYSNKNLKVIQNRGGYIITSYGNEENTACYSVYNLKKKEL